MSKGWLVVLWIYPAMALGGFSGSLGASYRYHSFAPLDEEPTPNYLGGGAVLALGYSLGMVLDLDLFATYHPSRFGSASLGTEDVQLYQYGAGLGVRMGEAVYFGVRGGPFAYHLINQTREDEIPGQWEGTGGYLMLGGVIEVDKREYLQIFLELGSVPLTPLTGDGDPRRLDWIGIGFNYVYIGLDRLSIDNVLLKDWINF